ncbi:MAG: hypothetical protein KAI47_18735 [Deltaproteobacteria bacterium]|nr:hypothetical protein [Deltaproteobacteria bacterium]
MSHSAATLFSTAATVAAVHTMIGVDHYVPFIALGKSSGWSLKKTLFWTTICGIGHVLSSVVIAVGAGALGWAIGSIQVYDAMRGDAAAYLLIVFGIGYAIWGLRHTHTHRHVHGDGVVHTHTHAHGSEHAADTAHDEAHDHDHAGEGHDHAGEGGVSGAEVPAMDASAKRRTVTIWTLFVIFVLGPCEPLIPLLVAPAITHEFMTGLIIVGIFGAITIGMMLLMVTLGMYGLGLLRFSALERWAHPLAGAAVAISGGLILLGL